MVKLDVAIGAMKLKNPVMTASGTFGYGSEFDDFFDVSLLGGNNPERHHNGSKGGKSLSENGRNPFGNA